MKIIYGIFISGLSVIITILLIVNLVRCAI